MWKLQNVIESYCATHKLSVSDNIHVLTPDFALVERHGDRFNLVLLCSNGEDRILSKQENYEWEMFRTLNLPLVSELDNKVWKGD